MVIKVVGEYFPLQKGELAPHPEIVQEILPTDLEPHTTSVEIHYDSQEKGEEKPHIIIAANIRDHASIVILRGVYARRQSQDPSLPPGFVTVWK